ncbi:MAG: manganese efflux pump MntP family protein [Thermodesulfobacteriota bacterium]
MNWISILGIAFALAMDAFAVAIVIGLSLSCITKRHIFRLAFHFGLFQALMPVCGWLAGKAVYGHIAAFDHWIAFCLLSFVGGKMLWEARGGGDDTGMEGCDPTRGISLVILSIATSIDALAVGLSLAMIGSSIVLPAVIIGLVATTLTTIGMLLGGKIGTAWGKWAETAGGITLIAIGLRILYTHMAG